MMLFRCGCREICGVVTLCEEHQNTTPRAKVAKIRSKRNRLHYGGRVFEGASRDEETGIVVDYDYCDVCGAPSTHSGTDIVVGQDSGGWILPKGRIKRGCAEHPIVLCSYDSFGNLLGRLRKR